MDFAPSAAHREFRESVAAFVDEEVAPRAAAIDRRDEFPAALVELLGKRGLMGMPFPETLGGAGEDYHAYADGLAEISRGSGAVGTIVAAHTSLAAVMVDEYGSADQRDRFLSALASGDEIGAFALSEAQAGSDVAAMGTRATRDGDGYRIDGRKQWTSNGSVAQTVVTFAKTGAEDGRELSAFVLRPDEDPGISIVRTEDKLGDRGCPTAEIEFDDVTVPVERRLGEEGEGFVQALRTLNGGRITIAARSIGLAEAALEETVDLLESSNGIDRTQAAEHAIADMATKIEAARGLMHRAADHRIRGESYVTEAAMAKLYASEVSQECTGRALEVCGLRGADPRSPLGRYYRDAKLNEIYEGTSEILRNTIASQLLSDT